MTQVVVSQRADDDVAVILALLIRETGIRAAEKYNARFERVYDLLAKQPELHALRPELGPSIRVAIVRPYLIIYRYEPAKDIVAIVRVLHGRRDVSGALLGRRP